MGRLKSLTILLALGAWGTATDGAPPDDAASAAVPSTRPQPPVHPSEYLKAAQRLTKKAAQGRSPKDAELASQYAKAASDYSDMLSPEDRSALAALQAQLAPPADPAVSPASTAGQAPPDLSAPPTPVQVAAPAPAPTPGVSRLASSAGGSLASRGTSPNDAKQQARWLLQSAKEQMAMGNYDDAALKIESARAMNVRWTLFDETPAKVSELLEKTRPKTGGLVAGGKGDHRQAKAKLKEARDLLAAGQYDQAESLAIEVATWGVRFNLIEDNPTKVASAARALKRREESRGAKSGGVSNDAIYATLVSAARQLMQAGKMDEAENKAREAAGMNVTPSLTADRAESVLHDIAMARASASAGAAPALAINDPAVVPTAVQTPPAETLNLGAPIADAPATAPVPVPAEPMPVAPLAAPADVPADAAAPPDLDTAPPAATGPGSSALDQARALLTSGNYPAARQAAMQAKQQGAGLEADNLLGQIGQTEQAAAFQIYESALASIRKGTESDMSHARGLLNELSSLEGLDESTQQRVQDLLMKLPREGAGQAQVGGSAIDDKEAVEAQRLNAEVGTKVAESRRLMETDPDKAIALLTATIAQVKAAGCKESVERTMTRRLEVAVELAKKDKVTFDRKMQDKTFKAEIENKKLRILEADKAKSERMKTLMTKAEEAMADGRFEEAEKHYGMAADIDPNNIAAVAGRTVSKTRRFYERDRKIRGDKDASFLEAMQNVDAASIVPGALQRDSIDMGEGFAGLTNRRRALAEKLSVKKTMEVIEIEKALNKPITAINFDKMTLSDAIKYLGDLTGQNFIVDKKALAEEGATMNSPVSFQANNLKLRTVLYFLLKDLNLTYKTDTVEGVILITSEQANQAQTFPRVYSVADLVVPIGAQQRPQTDNLGNISGSGTPKSMLDQNQLQAQANAMSASGGQFAAPPSSDVQGQVGGQRSDRNIDFNPLISLIKSAVAPGTWNDIPADAMGGSYGQGAAYGGAAGGAEDTAIGSITPFYLNISLIIRHTAEVHDDIVDLLRQLRRLQDLQVSVEVRFITVSDDFFEQIGVDFDFSIQSDAIGKGSTFAVANPAAQLGGATAGTAGTAVNPFLINPIRDHAIGRPPLVVGAANQGGGNTNPGAFTPDLQMPFTQGSAGSIAPFNALTGNTAATFGIAFLSDLEVYLFLTAVQGDTRSNLVQAPKVTSFNGAIATVSNFTARNYVSQLTPIVGAGSVAFFPTIGQVPDGVTLQVTPVVSADRRYVRMSLAPNFITFIQFDTFTVPAAVGGGGLGGQSSAINAQVQLPVFSLTNIQTTVTVPDGGTVLLGGVKRLREERREFGVPILSKTPLVNRLFRNIGIGRTTDSLMLMVTPRIIILEEEEEKLGIPAVNVNF